MRPATRRPRLTTLLLAVALGLGACDDGDASSHSPSPHDVAADTGADDDAHIAPPDDANDDSATLDLAPDSASEDSSPDLAEPDLDAASDTDAASDGDTSLAMDTHTEPPPEPEPIPYTNPVLDASGDPDVLEIDGTYYLYLPRQVRRDGQVVGGKVVAWTSTDLVHWTSRGAVYDNTDLAYGGERSRGLWAPEVLAHDGRFYLYLVNVMSGGNDASTVGNKDIVVVSSADPLDFHGQPQKILLDDAYAFIDPSPFVDPASGRLYLLYKRRGPLGTGSALHIRPMAGPRAFDGPATQLVHSDDVAGSENIVEHPMLHHQGGVYFLLYSFGKGDSAGSDGYRVRYATSRDPTGPFTQRGVLLGRTTVDGGKPIWAPGATSIVRDGDHRAWLVYRQKTTQETTFADRAVCIDRVYIRPGDSPPSMRAVPTRGIELDGPTPLSVP